MNAETLIMFTQYGKLFPLTCNSKEPMKRWLWKTNNTDDVQVIYEWVRRYPKANWALIPTRCLVVDVDCKNHAMGFESIEQAGGLPETFTVRTPSGGSHFYYDDPNHIGLYCNKLLPGVDIRGDGKGYVVLPYSVLPARSYVILNGDVSDTLAEMPCWLEAKLREKKSMCTYTSRFSGSSPRERSESTWEKAPLSSVNIGNMSRPCGDAAGWVGVRKEIRFRFFQKIEGKLLWQMKPTMRMRDLSVSGFSYQLCYRLAVVGATLEEITIVYECWCKKHRLDPKRRRFERSILPAALRSALPYIHEWRAKQPVRRKHGTTKNQILAAIGDGELTPKQLEVATGLSAII